MEVEVLEYDAERERGLDYAEDLFNPCVLRFDFGQTRNANIVASPTPFR